MRRNPYSVVGTCQVMLVLKKLPTNAGDIRVMGFPTGSIRSPGGGHGNPLQYSCLENPIPWTEELGGLQSTGLQRVRCNWRDLAQHSVVESTGSLPKIQPPFRRVELLLDNGYYVREYSSQFLQYLRRAMRLVLTNWVKYQCWYAFVLGSRKYFFLFPFW